MLWKLENTLYLCGDQRTLTISGSARHICKKLDNISCSFFPSRIADFRANVLWSGNGEVSNFLFIPTSNFSREMTKGTEICRSCDDSARDARNASEKATITFNKTILDGLFMTMPADRFGYAVGIVAKGYDDDDVLFRQGKDVQLAVNLLTTKLN